MDEEILAVKTRRDLYEFVRKNPGFHLREVSRALDLSITLVDDHAVASPQEDAGGGPHRSRGSGGTGIPGHQSQGRRAAHGNIRACDAGSNRHVPARVGRVPALIAFVTPGRATGSSEVPPPPTPRIPGPCP